MDVRHLRLDVVTIFPEYLTPLDLSLIGKARRDGLLDLHVHDLRDFMAAAHREGIAVAVATDLLSLTVLAPPGELGADVVLGSSQRFGVPMGYGGPHAAFFATLEKHVRQAPGRIIGVSVDAHVIFDSVASVISALGTNNNICSR